MCSELMSWFLWFFELIDLTVSLTISLLSKAIIRYHYLDVHSSLTGAEVLVPMCAVVMSWKGRS